MSTTVDERVVSLQFDNKNFEKNVSTSLNTLDKLKQKLNFSGASKGLEEVNTASQKVDMSTMEKGIDTVQAKFSALQVVAVSALATITSSAVNAGMRLASSLSVDQIAAGWNKYEQKTSSVQTIMNATGKSIDEVSQYLDKLMWYSDETSYGFTDMTASLAQLTSAGGDIDNLIPMIEGIANATAFAGKGAAEFSRAIYNLNQSYSAGHLQSMDWKSLDLAGVSSKQLKQTLIDTAEELGKITEGQVNLNNFTDTLKDEWADTEVMEKAFGKFAELTEAAYAAVQAGEFETASEAIQALSGNYDEVAVKAFRSAQEAKSFTEAIEATKDAVSSGWMKTSELIFGDYEEAKVLWTALSNTLWDVFASGAETRNAKLAKALSSGWSKYLDLGIMDTDGYSEYFMEVARTRGIAIDKMIEEEGSLEAAIRRGLQDQTIGTDILTESLDSLTAAYSGCSDEELKSLGYTREQVERLAELNEQFKNGELSIKEFADQMSRLSGRELLFRTVENAEGELEYFGALPNIFKAIDSYIRPIANAWTEIFNPITSDQIYNILQSFEKFTEKLKLSDERAEKLQRTFRGLFAALDIVWKLVKTVVKVVVGVLSKFGFLIDIFLSITACIGDLIYGLQQLLDGSSTFEKFGDGVLEVVSKVSDGLKYFFSLFTAKVDTGAFKSVSDALTKMWNGIKKVGTKIKNFFKNLGKTIIEAFSPENMESTFDTIVSLLTSGVLVAIIVGIQKVINYIQNTFSLLDISNAFGEFMESITDAIWSFQNKVNAQALKTVASAILMLVGALIVIAIIPKDKLYDSITTIGLLGAVLAVVFQIMKTPIVKPASIPQLYMQFKALGLYFAALSKFIINFGMSLLLMAGTLKTLAKLNGDEILRGFAAMVGIIAVMVAAIKVLGKSALKIGAAGFPLIQESIKQMVKLAFVMLLLASVFKVFSTFDWSAIGRSLTAMLGTLTIFIGSLALLQLVTLISDKAFTAKYLRKFAVDMLIMAVALKVLGTMDWPSIGKGLVALAGIMGLLVGTMTLLQLVGRISSGLVSGGKLGLGFIGLCAVLVTLGSTLLMIALIPWKKVVKGLVAIGISLTILSGVLGVLSLLDSKRAIANVGILYLLTTALIPISGMLLTLGLMNWDIIKRGLVAMGASLGILVGAMAILSTLYLTNMLSVSAALLVMSIALTSLIVPLTILGHMKTEALVKGLLAIAAAVTIFAVAGYFLAPLVPLLLILSLSTLALGRAMLVASVGFALFTGALAVLVGMFAVLSATLGTVGGLIIKFVVNLAKGIIQLIPELMVAVGKGIVALCDVIIEAAPKLAQALGTLILAALDFLLTLLPEIVSRVLQFVLGVLESLVQYIPTIVEYLCMLIINILDTFIKYIPDITVKLVEIFTTIFTSLVTALQNIDYTEMMNGLKIISMFSVMVLGLAAIAAVLPLAIIGVGGLIVISNLLVRALEVLSKLADRPNVYEKIDKACVILEGLGKAIGSLVGGFVGGFSEAYSNSLPQIATNLSKFMTNLQPFIDGINKVKGNIILNTFKLITALNLITAGSLFDSIVSFLTGNKSSLSYFVDSIKELADGLKEFSNSSSEIDHDQITAVVDSFTKVAEMASKIPVNGGLWSVIFGGKNLGNFGLQLSYFGLGLSAFVKSLNDVTINDTKISSAVDAGVKVAEMMSKLPVTGGLWGQITGKKNLLAFSTQLPLFGLGLKDFFKVIENCTFGNIDSAVDAGVKIAEMMSKLPVMGGLWNKLSGEQSLVLFSTQLPLFGLGLRDFFKVIENCTFGNIESAVDAGVKIADMMSKLPVTGGLWNKLAGEQNLANFSIQLPLFGLGLRDFLKSIGDCVFNNIDSAVDAGIKVADMMSKLPVTGGLWNKIVGEQNLVSFSTQLPLFGLGLRDFLNTVKNCTFENIDSVANAGVKVSEMISKLPVTGGLWSLIKGEQNLVSFSTQLPLFGLGLRDFLNTVKNCSFENMDSVVDAGVKVSEMISKLPVTGGLWSLIKGEQNLVSFSIQLPLFGLGLRDFLNKIKDCTFENIDSAANTGVKIAEMMSKLPVTGGLWSLIKGEQSLSSFSIQLPLFGLGLRDFLNKIKNCTFDNVESVANTGVKIAEMMSKLPVTGGLWSLIKGEQSLSSFSTQLPLFGLGVKNFVNTVSKANNFEHAESAAKIGLKVAEIAAKLPSAFNLDMVAFSAKLVAFGIGIKAFVNSVSDLETGDISATLDGIKKLIDQINTIISTQSDKLNNTSKTAGQNIIKAFVEGMNEEFTKVDDVLSSLADSLSTELQEMEPSLRDKFYRTGKYAGQGFVEGLKSRTLDVLDAARRLGQAAVDATNAALNINSPSKEYIQSGLSAGEGLTMGLDRSQDTVYNSAFGLGRAAVDGLRNTIAKISGLLDSDMELQPTITPVLNLDEVRSGIGTMNGMLSMSPSIGTLSRAASINAAVNSQIQNGGNGDVVSAIKGLQSSIEDNPREAININGITYSEGTELADAIKTIIRIAKIEGRV